MNFEETQDASVPTLPLSSHTSDFGIKKTVALARCGFGASLPSDLCAG